MGRNHIVIQTEEHTEGPFPTLSLLRTGRSYNTSSKPVPLIMTKASDSVIAVFCISMSHFDWRCSGDSSVATNRRYRFISMQALDVFCLSISNTSHYGLKCVENITSCMLILVDETLGKHW